MKTFLECIPCFFEQALRTARIATDDEAVIKKVLDELGDAIKNIPLENTPPQTGRLIYGLVNKITNNSDPYKHIKKESTQKALKLYPFLKEKVKKSNDRLLTAVRIAIVGNIIDFGVNKKFDIDKEISEIFEKKFAINHYQKFKERLHHADNILYIGDNAGESVFDKILIEEMNKPTMYVVREIPVINDVTYQDALDAGLDKVATIISSGTDAPGTVLSTCSNEFKRIFEDSEFTIAKGQGNYEALSNEKESIFFLLKTKCKVIANDIDVTEGDIILKGINV